MGQRDVFLHTDTGEEQTVPESCICAREPEAPMWDVFMEVKGKWYGQQYVLPAHTGSICEERREQSDVKAWPMFAHQQNMHSRHQRTAAALSAKRNSSPGKKSQQLAWLLTWKALRTDYFKLDKGALAKHLLRSAKVILREKEQHFRVKGWSWKWRQETCCLSMGVWTVCE